MNITELKERVCELLGWEPLWWQPNNPDIVIAQVEHEFAELLDVLKEWMPAPPRLILECGFFRGGTALLFRVLYPNAHIISIDLAHPESDFTPCAKDIFAKLMKMGKFTYICGSTNSPLTFYAVRQVMDLLGVNTVDFAFWDAEKDYHTYLMLMECLFSDDTVIVCHDWVWGSAANLAENPSLCYAAFASVISPYLHRRNPQYRYFGNIAGYLVMRGIKPANFYQFPYKITTMQRSIRIYSSEPAVQQHFGIAPNDCFSSAVVDATILGSDAARWDVSLKFAGFSDKVDKYTYLITQYSLLYGFPQVHTKDYFLLTDGLNTAAPLDWMWLFAHACSPRCRGVISLSASEWNFYWWVVGGKVITAPVDYLPLDGITNKKMLVIGAPSDLDVLVMKTLQSVARVEHSPQSVGIGDWGRDFRIAINTNSGNVAIATSMQVFLELSHELPTFFVTRNLFLFEDLDWFPPPVARPRQGIIVCDEPIAISNATCVSHYDLLQGAVNLSQVSWGAVICNHSGCCDAAAMLSRAGVPFVTNNLLVGAYYPLAIYSSDVLYHVNRFIVSQHELDNFLLTSYLPHTSFYRITPIRLARFLHKHGVQFNV